MEVLCAGSGSVYLSGERVDRVPEKGERALVLTRSRVAFEFDGARTVVPEDFLVLYGEGSRRIYYAEDEAAVCDWVSFRVDGDEDFAENLGTTYDRPFRASDPEFISAAVRNIVVEFYSLGARRAKTLDALMKLLLIRAEEASYGKSSDRQSADPHYAALIDLRAKIYRNPQLKWNVDAMAADVNMSRSYLQHVYREAFGVSCISDVISGKIEKAKEILSETSCTVSQVAFMCGYDNEEHFMRQFKKIAGVTPTAYRKSLRRERTI